MTRRQFIGAAVGLAAARPARAAAAPRINPRSAWGADHPPTGALGGEDVKFLLVHHSASQNGHTGADVPAILRGWHSFHTGPKKGWSDIAYNFVIDSEGGIWEARAGSLAGPVAGDATGGNQGFSQLVCLIGDFNRARPTGASLDSLVRLLAWLADRYGVSTAPGAEVAFTSRGSNRWAAGATVTTPTIVGHRVMSMTSCPGDNLNSYVTGALTADVEATRGGGSPPAAAPAATAPATAAATTAPATSVPTTTATTSPQVTTSVPTTTARVTASAPTTSVPMTAPTTSAGVTTSAPATLVPSTAPTTSAQVTASVPMTTATTSPQVTASATATAGDGGGRTLGLIASGAMFVSGVALLAWRWRRLRP